MSESFAPWLKRRRRQLGLTQEGLAARLAVATTTIRKLEAGARRPSRALAQSLAEALDIPAAEQASFVAWSRETEEQAPTPIPMAPALEPMYHIPAPLTSLIGRDEALSAICARLREPGVRLLSLVGAPGIGKTRLALAAAQRMRHEFAQGVVFVPLATIGDPEGVLPAVARSLHLQEAGSDPVLERVATFAAPREMLLVLDNFEQVVEAGAALSELLAAAPGLKILTTTRVALRLYAEHRFAVPPLPVPVLPVLPPVAQLAQVPAVALFLERARATGGDFALNESNAPAVAALCVHLDGLPLALELAAARTELFSVQSLLERMQRREGGASLPLLQQTSRDVSPRHQTIAAAVAWSYDLLAPAERRLLRRLAVFSGGFSPSAAEAIWAEQEPAKAEGEQTAAALGAGASNAEAQLASLLEKSLVQPVARQNRLPTLRDGEPRFSLLQVVREYALERLQVEDDPDEARRRHLRHYLALTVTAYERMDGAETGLWLDRLEEEHDNLRAALRWALAGNRQEGVAEQVEEAAALLQRLWWFWHVRGYYSEGRRWLARMLREPTLAQLSPLRQGHLYNGAGVLSWDQGDYATAQSFLAMSLEKHREAGNRRGVAAVLGNLGIVARRQGNYDYALACQQECLALCREEGHAWSVAVVLNNLGELARDMGDRAKATAYWQECLALRRAANDVHGMGTTLLNLGGLALDAGHTGRARELLQEALSCLADVGARAPQAQASLLLGDLARLEEKADEALDRYRQALGIYQEGNDQEGIAESLEYFAALATGQGQVEEAAVMLGAAEGLREALHSQHSPPDRARYESTVRTVRALLSPSTFITAWARGKRLSQEDVLQLARAIRVGGTHATSPTAPSEALTGREIEVLRLVARGLSNAEVARELSVSQHTVSAHLRSIYDKLDVHSRSAATRFALDHGVA